MLVKNDPWEGKDCERDECLQCETKIEAGVGVTQDCSRRNCVYETWCGTCEEREKEKEKEGG